MPRISVIVPVYRVEQYLGKCVRSLLEQTYKDFEIILVNDGSPDSCPDMINDFQEKYPNTILSLHKTNGGLGDARNYAIPYASGEYISFVDSDDTVEPEFLKCLYDTAVSTDADIVVCDSKRVYENNDITQYLSGGELLRKQVSNIIESPDWLFRVSTNAWNKLYRTKLFRDCATCRYPVGLIYEDLGLTPILFHRATRIAKIDRALYNYLTRQGSIISTSRRPEDVILVLNRVFDYFAAHEPRQYHDELAMLYIRHGIIYRYLQEWPGLDYLTEILRTMSLHFGQWRENPYLKELPGEERKEILRLATYGAVPHYMWRKIYFRLTKLFRGTSNNP